MIEYGILLPSKKKKGAAHISRTVICCPALAGSGVSNQESPLSGAFHWIADETEKWEQGLTTVNLQSVLCDPSLECLFVESSHIVTLIIW